MENNNVLMKKEPVHRGDVFYANLNRTWDALPPERPQPFQLTKVRPVIIVQTTGHNCFVIPLKSSENRIPSEIEIEFPILESRRSYLAVTQATLIPMETIQGKIGTLNEKGMAIVNRALVKFIGLNESYVPPRKKLKCASSQLVKAWVETYVRNCYGERGCITSDDIVQAFENNTGKACTFMDLIHAGLEFEEIPGPKYVIRGVRICIPASDIKSDDVAKSDNLI